MLEITITLLLIGIIVVSMFIGFALGQICQRIEDNQCNAPINSPEQNPPAPGADWGTWSTYT